MVYKKVSQNVGRFIADCNITDDRNIFESSPVPMYLVDDLGKVEEAYKEDMENRPGFIHEDDIGAFLDRHNIKWE